MRFKILYLFLYLVSFAFGKTYDPSPQLVQSLDTAKLLNGWEGNSKGKDDASIKVANRKEGTSPSSQTKQTPDCAGLRRRCIGSEDCCPGTVCRYGVCKEGAEKKKYRRELTDQIKLIEMEMSTGNNVDVTAHENVDLLASFEECGRSLLNKKKKPHSRYKRIVGGKSYEEGKYPWMVALHLTFISTGKTLEELHCGGSLISKQYVLTAAHCGTRIPSGLMLKYATFGNVDRRAKLACEKDPNSSNCTKGGYLDVEIDDVIIHEDFSDANTRNDIALIRLKHEVNYTDYIQPICLPLSEKIFKRWRDGRLTVAGWGSQNLPTDTGPAKYSLVAQEVDMLLVHRNNCDRFFTRAVGQVRRSQICAVGQPSKADCGGDSGGPLFKRIPINEENNEEEKDERYFVFGLVSTGDDKVCGREGKPSIFTNLVDYMPWLLDHLVPKSKVIGESIARMAVNPVEEFATGFSMDVRGHKNIALLPNECGKIEDQLDHSGPARSMNVSYHTRVKRIVGGIIQSVGIFPWMAQIYLKHVVTSEPDFRCGGALITSRHVLTAAHCVADIRGPYAMDGVMLGNFNRQQKNECIGNDCINQLIVPVEEMFVHEGFAKYARVHDVAIIKLAHDVRFNRFVRPICLPLYEDIVAKAWPKPEIDRRYVAAGWGQVSSYEDSSPLIFSNLLVGANFTLESKKYCESALIRNNGKLENTRICGGGSIPGRGECTGDTGGPMMRWVTEEISPGQTLTKMYTFGVLTKAECAHQGVKVTLNSTFILQGIPSLYQNLLYHMPWVMDHLDA